MQQVFARKGWSMLLQKLDAAPGVGLRREAPFRCQFTRYLARIDAEQDPKWDLVRFPIGECCHPIGPKAREGKVTNRGAWVPDMPIVTIDVIASIKSASVSTSMAPYFGTSASLVVVFNSGPQFSKSTGTREIVGFASGFVRQLRSRRNTISSQERSAAAFVGSRG